MRSKNNQNPIIRLYLNLIEERRLLFFAFLSSIINKILDLAPPVIIGLAVDIVVKEQNSWIAGFGIKEVPAQLIFLAFASGIVWSGESSFEYLYSILWRNLAQLSQHKLRIKAYEHIQELDMDFFENDNTGRLLSILNDDINQLERFLDQGANQIIQLFITVLIIGGTMIFVAPKIALFAFFPIPIIFLGSIKFQRKLAPKYRDVRNKAGLLASRLNNNLSGILTIKSFTKEKWELNRLNKESLDYQRSNKAAIKLSSAFIPLIRFAILFAFIAILLIGGFQTWNKTLDVGTYSFLVFITQRLLWPLTTLGHVLDDFQRSMASIDRVIDLIDTPIKIKDGKIKIEPKDIKGEIIFNNVNFNYPGRDLTLKNINFKIENNSTLGIVGLTGSGGMTHDIGFRGTVGARVKDVMPGLTIGMYAQTEQPHEYDNLHVTSMHGSTGLSVGSGIAQTQPFIKCNGTSGNVCRQDVRVEQPWNVGLGFAYSGLMNGNLLVMGDFTHKAWDDARFFNEFYDDQQVYSVGLQLTQGPMKFRLGYGYACLLYTSPSPRDRTRSRMPSSA